MGTEKILIVEDEQIVALDLGRVLQRIGYQNLMYAARAEEALEAARKEQPDIVLMDIKLDGKIDGIHAAGKIQEEYGIPVIYVTANADDATVERAKLTKPFGFILKPFNQREIQSNIKITLYRYHQDRELQESHQLCFESFQSLSDAVIVTDMDGFIRFINPMAAHLLALSRNETEGRQCRDVLSIVDEESEPVIDSLLTKTVAEGRYSTFTEPLYLCRNDSDKTPVSFSAAILKSDDADQRGIVVLLRDNTNERRVIEELKQNAFNDPLTGLPNRRFIIQYIRQCFARMSRQKDYLFAVLYLDLDGFKNINDRYGHTIGDEVLIRTGKLLMSTVRPTDTVSRLGGDEYLLLLDNIKSKECAQLVSKRILEGFSESFEIRRQKIKMSTSIGICVGTTGLDDEKIIKNADAAMYSVKDSGKASYAFFGEQPHRR